MELRYIDYAGGNFSSCQDAGIRSEPERIETNDAKKLETSAPPAVAPTPAPAPARAVTARASYGKRKRVAPTAPTRLDLVPLSDLHQRPADAPVDAKTMFGSGEIPDPVLVGSGLKIAPVAPATPPAEAPAPAPEATIAPTPDEITTQALQRLAERRAREAAKHAEREIERKKRQEALAAERRMREDGEQSKRNTSKIAKEAGRRSQRAVKEVRRRERELAHTRKKIGLAPNTTPVPPSRAHVLATHAAAAFGLVAAIGASIWYFTAEHGRFEREVRLVTTAAAGTPAGPGGKVAIPATARSTRVQQAALLSIASVENAVERRSFQHVVRVQRGEYFRDLLMRSGVNGADAQLAQISLAGVYDVRKMRAGQLITVDFGILGEEHNRFLGVRFDSNYDRTVWIQRQSRGDYVATEIKKELTLQILRNNGVIDHSVFQAGLQSGMPPEPVVRMINLFAYDVDFQRDVQKGDTFETLIEQHRDRNGDVVRYGNILYAALTIQGSTIKLYRWQGDDGEADYFTEKGDSSRKALMRTPIDGARLASGFGYRRHPILGYSKMHQGVDFAAPTGTPIYAAGAGQLEKIGWQGGYGNAIVIRHTKDYSTLYGHMSGFAPGMQPGKRVKQGDIIGYVGSTGMSTGPHLHYEVHLAGKQIDPLSLKLPSRQRLAGAELARYLEMVKTIDARWQGLAKNGAAGNGIVMAGDQEADTGCVNGTRLDPTDKRACE